MTARWLVLLALASSVVSCGAPGGGHVPAGNVATGESDGGSSTPTDERQGLHDRLANAIAPLLLPPFGTAVAATSAIGTIESTAALGTLWDGGPSATDDARFNVASVSKALTAARVVSLAHADTLGLDDPLSKHLPGMKLVDKGGVDRAGTITIRQLVQHRSGLPHVPKDLDRKVANRWSSPDLLRVLTDSWEIALDGAPGQYSYSNFGYALLGAIIERTGNCSFADCMSTYLGELGMAHATFWPKSLGDEAARGRVVTKGAVTFNEPGWYASRYALPFSGLWTSMPDLARFGSIVMAASKDPASPLHGMTAPDGEPLGLFPDTRLDATSLEHDGSGPGFHAQLIVIPSKSVVLAMATNGGNENKDEGRAFANVVRDTLSAVPAP